MWRRIRSALFIDFENVATKPSATAISSLLAWLEDGKFDDAQGKRLLLRKTVYWNSSAERHRDVFEDAGFEVMLCEKFSAMKNGADIRMALDILDTCWKDPDITEYILFTTDSDFVPVLQRLTEKSKTSAILVNETKMESHTAFSIYADVLIPLRHLNEAFIYDRKPKGLINSFRNTISLTPTLDLSPKSPFKTSPATVVDTSSSSSGLNEAERAVVRLASRTPKKFVPRKQIERQLQQIEGFKKTGTNAYFGRKHYQALMLEIAKNNSHIKVRAGKAQSASVMYVPPGA
jgi:uncharacterized LabA/DUF88 family protein